MPLIHHVIGVSFDPWLQPKENFSPKDIKKERAKANRERERDFLHPSCFSHPARDTKYQSRKKKSCFQSTPIAHSLKLGIPNSHRFDVQREP